MECTLIRRELLPSAVSATTIERCLNPGYHDHCLVFFDCVGSQLTTLPETRDHHIMLDSFAAAQINS